MNTQIRKHIFGNPFVTYAVPVDKMDNCPDTDNVAPFSFSNGSFTDDNGEVYETSVYTLKMSEDTCILGLGENVRGINKRGHVYESWNTDDPGQHEEKKSLYGSHNFLVAFEPAGHEAVGIFIDSPGRVIFDAGFTDHDTLTITVVEKDYVVYLLESESAYDLIRSFRELIGQSYLAPKWSFGFMQSRWGYKKPEDFRAVRDTYRESGMPIDSICMDIDYMDSYKDFTFNSENFPDFKAFVDEFKADGIRFVPIIDAGVKIEPGYDTYEEGIKNDYFVKRDDGTPFVGGVWPGRTHFPDFFKEDAAKWFGHKYSVLTEAGIEGFWNDMNEPALFYSEEGLEKLQKNMERVCGGELNIDSFFWIKDQCLRLQNSPDDYRLFYHEAKKYDGTTEVVRHDHVHNIYGHLMTKSATEAFQDMYPDRRTLLFSRASYIGMHRYGGIWTGDNTSAWTNLLYNIQMMPSLNMCGFLYTGADLGGFGGHTEQELMLRWISFGIFTPLMRNHSALGTRLQELYRFKSTQAFKSLLRLRYRLIPYIYSEYMKSALNSDCLFRPLCLDYPSDLRAARVEDQLMFGHEIMLAPVYAPNVKGRYVYLPKRMKCFKFTSDLDYTEQVYEAGDHFIECLPGEVLIFVKEGKCIPLADNESSNASFNTPCVEKINYSSFTYLSYAKDGEKPVYELYND